VKEEERDLSVELGFNQARIEDMETVHKAEEGKEKEEEERV
jgi:hypothetical protein